MALTGERRASLLAYCRIEPEELTEEDSVLLEIMFESAVGYLAGAGVSAPAPGTKRAAQYDLCVNALVLEAWDRRSISLAGTVVSENPVFRQTLNQLKLTEPVVSNPDTIGGSEDRDVR